MPQQVTCPSEQELLGFHLGTLPDQELDAVAGHLDDCTLCQTRVQRLDGETDPVLTLLRSSGGPGQAAAGAAIGPGGAALPRGLLDPPQGPGELGRLGHYRLLRVIGRGGMGYVFEGEDLRLRRRVAVKVIQPGLAEDTEARQRFLREARVMAGIRPTEHVVILYDVDEERRIPYLAMELLDGDPLDRWLQRRGPVPVADILRLGREAALGLAAVHEHGLVHRDIKPANLWVEAATGTVKVLDFGLARTTANEDRLTGSDVIAGTPAYLSPEQAQGERLDPRSDLFSLGSVLYELCAGRPPFRGKTPLAVMAALTTTEPTPLRSLRPDVPPALASLVAQLLAKNPARRPPSARAVAERLAAIRPGRAGRRPRVRTWAGVLLAVAALFLGAAVVRVQTSKGTVEIRAAPGVKVLVEQDGELVTILDPESKQQVELRAGEYHVKLGADAVGLKLSTDQFTLRRGGKEILTVRRVVPPAMADAKLPAGDAWARGVAGLKAEEQVKAVTARLRALNPEFKSEVAHLIEDGVVRRLSFRTDHVRDISPVRALTGLRSLDCSGAQPDARQFKDLGPLRGLKLTELMCHNSAVSDLSPLEGMPLTLVNCAHSVVTSLAPLKGMRLTQLSCDFTQVADLRPLEGMPLTFLNCGVTRVADLSPVKGMPLTFLSCGSCPLADLGPLRGLPLTSLYCDRTDVADLAPLRGMSLTTLICYRTKITSLAPLEGMPLTTLNFGVTRVADLSPLKGMRLTMLGCGETAVSDLSVVKGMPLTTVWCNDTQVSDLEPLRGLHLTTLLCGNTRITSLAALEGMPLKELGCDLRLGRDTQIVRGLRTLETINGIPASEFWRAAGKKEP